MSRNRFVWNLALRESRAAGRRLFLLTAAISIGVGALVAIESFTDNLRIAVENQSRGLLGGDVSLGTRSEPAPPLKAAIDSAIAATGADRARDVSQVTSFSGMAYVPRTAGAPRMVQVNAVEGGYPFYGTVQTQPAGTWPRLQQERVALVDPSFLTAMSAEVGDTMALGETRYLIAGTVTAFPGDAGIRSAFGSRVFIPANTLPETKLLGFGSRVEYEWFIRTPRNFDTKNYATTWRDKLRPLTGRLRTAEEEERDLKRNFDQLGRYLGLVALIALLLGGIGVGSAVQVFIRRKRDSIAVLRCLGATSGQVFAAYLLQAAAMGLAGSGLGVVLGLVIQLALPKVFGAFMPLDVAVTPSLGAILTGLGVGLWVSTIFALLPLLGIRQVPPLAVLRRDVETNPAEKSDRWALLARLGLGVSVIGLASLEVRNLAKGAGFSVAIGIALLILYLAARGLTAGLKRWFPHGLTYTLRQGLSNLYRPANQTVAVVLSLGFGAFLLGALAVSQHNLLNQLKLDGGLNRPNLLFFDIQPDQLQPVEAIIREHKLEAQAPVPIVPMRLYAINGKTVSELLADTARKDRDGERIPGWALRREFRSTYRDTSVGSEKVLVGDWWKKADRRSGGQAGSDSVTAPGSAEVVPLSLETGIAGDLGVTVRDTLVWDVQGVRIASVIVNLREVNWARFEPNFFAVFPTGPLNDAPQSFVLLTRADDPAQIGQVQRAAVQRYPNVTSIDLRSIQQTIERIVSSVALAIRFMALLSLATGVVVLIGALATSRFQRMREAALLKTLGATRSQVVRIMVTEYAALGILASVVATGLSAVGGWALMKWVFEIPFTVPWAGFGILALTMVGLTIATGLWNSLDVFRRPPLETLRTD
ncbi:MAG: FtsX-like permease family protein [Gemmatimonadales bacterium]